METQNQTGVEMSQRDLREHLSKLFYLTADFLRHLNDIEQRVEDCKQHLPPEANEFLNSGYFGFDATDFDCQEAWESAVAGITRAGEMIDFLTETHWVYPRTRRMFPLECDLTHLLERQIVMHRDISDFLSNANVPADSPAASKVAHMKVRELSRIAALEAQLIELGGTPPMVEEVSDPIDPSERQRMVTFLTEPAPF